MFIDKRSLIIGVCLGMIFLGVVGLVNAISYRDRLDELEGVVRQRESTIQEQESLNALLEKEVTSLDSARQELEKDLLSLEENCSQLKTRLTMLETNNSALANEIQLLERAVHIIGQEEIEGLLRAYTEVSLQHAALQREYDELLSRYNKLVQSP
jgi:chromosome segregation ATPase